MAKKQVKGEDGKVYTVKEKKPFYKRVWFWIVAIIALFIIGGALGGDEDEANDDKDKTETVVAKDTSEDTSDTTEVTETTDEESDTTEATETTDEESDTVEDTSNEDTDEAEDTTDDVPADFKSALAKAQQYNDTMYMSKAGLLDQLTSEYGEQFSQEAGQYAVDHVEADWKENALKKAKDYQEQMAMSPEGIRDQLVSEYGEQFTQEEADYAVENLNK